MDISGCIQYLRDVIDVLKQEVAESKIDRYEKALEDIERRKKDPCLNVALIGDFSSGKSTFINSFIQKELLKTAWLATTAVPTHIMYHDGATKIFVECTDHVCYQVDKEKERELLEKRLGISLPREEKSLIAALSTDNRFSEDIKLIRIWTQGSVNFKDICIIDTPGVNPGAADTKKHVEMTREVLRKYADATIVLFQSTMVYTHSFEMFLKENASHFMNDAVFIITMMDLKEQEERDELTEYVRNRLKEAFSLENPRVYGCSAKYASVISRGISDEEGYDLWKQEFDILREEILQYMEAERTRIIGIRLQKLLVSLMKELDEEVRDSMNVISARLKLLEENSVENLKVELKANKEKYSCRIQRIYRELNAEKKYNQLFSRMIQRAEAEIDSCSKIRGDFSDSITGYMNYHFQRMLEAEQKLFRNNLEKEMQPVCYLVNQFAKEEQKLFEKYNVALQKSVGNLIALPDLATAQGNLENISYSDMGNIEMFFALATMIAAMPLYILDEIFGTNTLDTLGDALSVFLDGWVNLFSNLSNKKREAKSRARQIITEIKNGNKDKFLSEIKKQEEKVWKSMEDIVSACEESYRRVYSYRMEEFKKEKASAQSEMEKKKNIHRKLDDLLKSIGEGR